MREFLIRAGLLACPVISAVMIAAMLSGCGTMPCEPGLCYRHEMDEPLIPVDMGPYHDSANVTVDK